MAAKLDGYTDVITRLAGETVKCSAPGWERGLLSIQCDGMRLTYQLKNEDSTEKAILSETLRDQIDELYIRMRDAGDVWIGASLNWWREANDLKFNIAFEYPSAKAPELAPPPTPKQPWWKFGRR